MMTRKDYEAIASAIKSANMKWSVKRKFIKKLLPVFKADNSLFHAGRSMEACKPEELTITYR